MRKILLLLAAVLLQQATLAQNTWTGSTSTRWNVASNWSTNQVPTASDDVIIPAGTIPPVISTVGAAAKTVEVQSDATLTIKNTGSLAVNGSKFTNGGFTTAFYNAGTVNNSGQLLIGNTSAVGDYGLLNQATFNNNTGGQITIDRSIYGGLYNAGGSFTNAATITIGAAASAGAYGLLNLATFNNNTGGQISIDNSSFSGLMNNTGAFTNAAAITIGAVAGVGNYGLYNLATFNNNTGGEIKLDQSFQYGLRNAGGTFTNAAAITIGAVAGVGIYGLWNEATFNNTGGQISIDRSTSDGLINTGGSFTNAAAITIGAVAGVGNYGLFNQGTFNNNTGGQIGIDRSTNTGLYSIGGTFTNAATITIGAVAGVGQYGLFNQVTFNNNTGGQISIDRSTNDGLINLGGSFTNAAIITIGASASVGGLGLRNDATFNNNQGGEITIDRSTDIGLYNAGGTFTNAATITIGGSASGGDLGLLNYGTFNNNGCSVLTLFAPVYNQSSLTNEGLFTVNTTGTHTNTGFTNNGILVYPQGNPIPNVTNQAIVASPLSGCTTITPALEIGNNNPFTIGSTWYKDQALTQPAGTFTIGDNSFTATGLSTGSTTVYFTISNGDTCNQTVTIPVTLLDGCTECSNATSLNTTNITANSARLEWIASSDPANWRVQYKKAISGASWTKIKLAGSKRSINISSLEADQNYRWRIQAKCGTTWSTFSAQIKFKTLSSALLSTGTQQAVSIKNVTEEKSPAIKLYPNPTRGQFVIELHLANNISANAKIALISTMGQTVSTDNANITNGMLYKNASISSSLPAGMYIVRIIVNNKTYTAKLIYEK